MSEPASDEEATEPGDDVERDEECDEDEDEAQDEEDDEDDNDEEENKSQLQVSQTSLLSSVTKTTKSASSSTGVTVYHDAAGHLHTKHTNGRLVSSESNLKKKATKDLIRTCFKGKRAAYEEIRSEFDDLQVEVIADSSAPQRPTRRFCWYGYCAPLV